MAVIYVHSPVEVIIPSDNGVTVDITTKALVVPVPSGPRGLPGYSPTVSTSPIDGGTEVTIHYEDGEVSFDVMNGEQGETGETGPAGPGVASGGTTGQVLKKRSNADCDTVWGNLPTVPTKTSDLTNDSGFVDAAGAAAAAPVQSVNGQTGAVTVTSLSLLDVYPVGSIYMSVNSVSPAMLFGGTWEQIEDRFLLAAGTAYTAGDTGGEATHTLTVDEMPSHIHGMQGYWNVSTGSKSTRARSTGGSDPVDTNGMFAAGGDQPHNNMPPYLAVYVWKRTA